ncbi:hypothetical protein RCL1_001451 [Eukaryota sp. TZLM3-RCL]
MSTLDNAYKQFLLENAIITDTDKLFGTASETELKIRSERPWNHNPKYFQHVKMSAIALMKIVMHAHSGGSLEIMGMLSGRVVDHTFIVLDAIPLPVEGTETRVNAQDSAFVYMTEFREASEKAGRYEHICGWYHSHPGFGCWLSGIDVATQRNNQMTDPFVAVVVDPVRTSAAGRVEIGSFRTFPHGYDDRSENTYSTSTTVVPSAKFEDFGANWREYYQLETSFFKTSRDEKILQSLFRRFWSQTLASSPLKTSLPFLTDTLVDLHTQMTNQRGDRAAKQKVLQSTKRVALDLMGAAAHEMAISRLFSHE